MSQAEVQSPAEKIDAATVPAAPVEPTPPADGGRVEPTPVEWAALNSMERFAFRVSRRMNEGRWKEFWTFCQRTVGMGWIRLCTYNLMRVHGLEHFDAVSHDRPILLASNHRSSSTCTWSRRAVPPPPRGRKAVLPVRGRFFSESVPGMIVNS